MPADLPGGGGWLRGYLPPAVTGPARETPRPIFSNPRCLAPVELMTASPVSTLVNSRAASCNGRARRITLV